MVLKTELALLNSGTTTEMYWVDATAASVTAGLFPLSPCEEPSFWAARHTPRGSYESSGDLIKCSIAENWTLLNQSIGPAGHRYLLGT
jgi:hypothetical protein